MHAKNDATANHVANGAIRSMAKLLMDIVPRDCLSSTVGRSDFACSDIKPVPFTYGPEDLVFRIENQALVLIEAKLEIFAFADSER